MEPWLQCLLSALAVWRITHLIVTEEGPWLIFSRIRDWAGPGFWGQLLNCFYCLSLWVAAPFAWWLGFGWPGGFVAWWALSGAAVLLERSTRGTLDVHVGE